LADFVHEVGRKDLREVFGRFIFWKEGGEMSVAKTGRSFLHIGTDLHTKKKPQGVGSTGAARLSHMGYQGGRG